ncbi:hypothetical protein FDP41_006678 [Naegleria fowleri]|uniref:Cyclic nucleotide-binding domain-containing protein n=1 Tax=Naegleria fowleri TaxID=5763 RepID=A0A6A5BJ37_NAEFO|nr:uncharacterized protein FDP41_006678 [Naegleria fowleri]KAF0974068.1 hypothetical protein FDP41_006678 [Naegleria fowleri]CAG4716646.1 unnamed protein product [Naegleria fowleri]
MFSHGSNTPPYQQQNRASSSPYNITTTFGSPPPFSVSDLQQYLQEKRVEELFVSLMQAICLERPQHIIPFLHQKLAQIECFAGVVSQQQVPPQTSSQPQPVQQFYTTTAPSYNNIQQQPPQPQPVQPQPQAYSFGSSQPKQATSAKSPPSIGASSTVQQQQQPPKSPSPFSWDNRSAFTEPGEDVSAEKPPKANGDSSVRFAVPSPSSNPLSENSAGIDWNESENRRRRYSISVARRRAVSSEVLDESKPLTAEELQVHHKTPEEMSKLREALASNALFTSLEPEDLKIILDAMFEVNVKKGDTIIRQGDEQGDLFYVIYSGECEALKKNGNEEKVVKDYSAGDAFGELALIYGTPRAATVRAKSDCKLYAIDRVTFRRIVMLNTKRKREMYEDFLKRVPILETLTDYERMTVADALVQETYDAETDKGRYIIRQGDRGDAFYIIIEGEVVVKKKANLSDINAPEEELTRLSVGDYFGEIALLTDQTRQASVCIPEDATENVKLVRLNRKDFKSLLGPCEEILKRNMRLYTQYVTQI